jgi:hypothetical protein
MVVFNDSADERKFKTARFGESLKGRTSGTDIMTGKTVNVTEEMTVAPKSALILELN